MKKILFVLLVGALLALMTGCASAPESSEQQLEKKEQGDFEKIYPLITSVQMTPEEIESVGKVINGEEGSIGSGTVSYDGNRLNVLGITGAESVPSVLVPTVQWSVQSWKTLIDLVTSPTNSVFVAEKLIHWGNHFQNPWAISANGTWLHTIVTGAANGEGAMYIREATESAQAQYLFVSKVGTIATEARPWATLLAENGAPITAFDYGLKNGKPNINEPAKYLGKLLERGYTQITRDQLPESIKKNWLGSKPPVIRYIWWAASFQAQVLATSLATWAGTSMTDFIPLFFIAPDCNNSRDAQMYPYMCPAGING